jgi:hypothetical protein
MNLKDAINHRRLHHQLYPVEVDIEEDFDIKIQKKLYNEYKHKIRCFNYGGSIVQAVSSLPLNDENNLIQAFCDNRKGSKPDGI